MRPQLVLPIPVRRQRRMCKLPWSPFLGRVHHRNPRAIRHCRRIFRRKRFRRRSPTPPPIPIGPQSFERRAGSRIGPDDTQFATHIESGKRRPGYDDTGFSPNRLQSSRRSPASEKFKLATPRSRKAGMHKTAQKLTQASLERRWTARAQRRSAHRRSCWRQQTAFCARSAATRWRGRQTARLIFSVPPSYPKLAKSQRVSGNILIDALIDPPDT